MNENQVTVSRVVTAEELRGVRTGVTYKEAYSALLKLQEEPSSRKGPKGLEQKQARKEAFDVLSAFITEAAFYNNLTDSTETL